MLVLFFRSLTLSTKHKQIRRKPTKKEEILQNPLNMALSVVSSKFALLPDDDEDRNKKDLKSKVLGTKNNNVTNESSENATKAKKKKNKNKKKQNSGNDDSKDLQALAFGKKRTTSTSSNGRNSRNGQNGTTEGKSLVGALTAQWENFDMNLSDQSKVVWRIYT